MKKLTLKVFTSITFLTFGFVSANAISDDYSKIDVEKVCDVKANGIQKVIDTAKKYNLIAQKVQKLLKGNLQKLF